MHKTPIEWTQSVLGRGYNIDGYYGNQCWDGFAKFCKDYNYSIPHCIYSGGVKDIARLYNEGRYDLSKNFKSVSPYLMEDGDWVVWGASMGGGYGHVAMFRRYNQNGSITVLGQNQGGTNGAFNQINLNPNGIIIVLRPNCYKMEEPKKETKVTWEDTIVKVGDTVKSKGLAFQSIQGNCIKCNALGGLVPLAHVSEYDAGDGKKDNFLKNTKSKIYLDPTVVQAIDKKKSLVMVHGYWVKVKPLLVKKVHYV